MDKEQIKAELADLLEDLATPGFNSTDIAEAILSLREAYCDDNNFLVDEESVAAAYGLEDVGQRLSELSWQYSNRDLDFHSKPIPVANGIAKVIAICGMPVGYGDFCAKNLVEELATREHFDFDVVLGREGSVVVYFAFGLDNNARSHKIAYDLKSCLKPDEFDFGNYESGLDIGNVWRFWWD